MNPRPLDPLISSPRYLLDKARRDLARLETATFARDETDSIDAMLDAAGSVYNVKDWVGVINPGYKVAALEYAHGSAWILLCRDICHASKHVGLRLADRTFIDAPQVADRVDLTITASTGVFVSLPVLKVFSAQHGNHYAPDVIREAIIDWDRFLLGKKIT